MASGGGLYVACRRLVAFVSALAAAWLVWGAFPLLARQATPSSPLTDLDAFMARVLERRNENWKTLHDYILSERESFQVLGPGGIPLIGQRREFNWFIRDGYLVRSPIKANGASIGERDRQQYEANWLANEKAREQRAREKGAARERKMTAAKEAAEAEFAEELRGIDPVSDKEIVSMVGGEPRFISEAYFMKFRFEPGNYYLAGRETLDGRPVVKIEYYPSRMFSDENDDRRERTEVNINATAGEVKVRPAPEKPKTPPAKTATKKVDEEDDLDREIEAAMNKVTQVTMWIDPQEYQIVKFTFDNVDWGFLPGRAIIRVDEARASMTMGRYFEDVWLPKEIVFRFGATFASGSYTLAYSREFHDYRKGEVSARIRAYVPKDP
jgi:hypothetical protein